MSKPTPLANLTVGQAGHAAAHNAERARITALEAQQTDTSPPDLPTALANLAAGQYIAGQVVVVGASS